MECERSFMTRLEVQQTHYYPFGGTIADLGTASSFQHRKYNGKELDRMFGLDYYDYGARQYDPILLRFTSPDPLAEKAYGTSMYAYCGNNPINKIEINGLFPEDAFPTPDAAALNFGMIYNYLSIKDNVECESIIYFYFDKKGNKVYSYNKPNFGTDKETFPNTRIPYNSIPYATIHTHAAYSGDDRIDNYFSEHDIKSAKSEKLTAYLCTPDGQLKKLHKKEDGTFEYIIFKGSKYNLPSDSHYTPNGKLSVDKIYDKFGWFKSNLREKYLDEISK